MAAWATVIRLVQGVEARRLIVFVSLMILITLMWHTVFIYPLKILVVFFHELSHGLVALGTGGRVLQITLNPEEGGYCVTQGGSLFLILNAGYLGSLIWGGIILLIAARTNFDRQLTGLLGSLLLIISLLWIRPVISFGFGFIVVIGIILLVVAVKASGVVCEMILKLLGLTSCMYAVQDILSDVLHRPGLPSDARMLAELTHIPTVIWGAIWLLLASLTALFFLLLASQRRKQATRLNGPKSDQQSFETRRE